MPLALIALATGGFAIGTTEFVTMGLLPDIADGINESIPTTGHIITAYALGVVVGAPMIVSARPPGCPSVPWWSAWCWRSGVGQRGDGAPRTATGR